VQDTRLYISSFLAMLAQILALTGDVAAHAQIRVVNIPWSQIEAEATQRDEPLSVVLTLWLNAISFVFFHYRGCIFAVKQHTIRVDNLINPIMSQIERLRAFLVVVPHGARSKATMSPFVLLRLHGELCLLRALCFSCTTHESAAIRSAKHIQALVGATITLSVSRGSQTAEKKRRRKEAAERVARGAVHSQTAHNAGVGEDSGSSDSDTPPPDGAPDSPGGVLDGVEDDEAPRSKFELWLRAAKSLPHRNDMKACLRLYKLPVSGARGVLEARLADYWSKFASDPDMKFVINCLIDALPSHLSREVQEAMEDSE
jgi:hypothetical protein